MRLSLRPLLVLVVVLAACAGPAQEDAESPSDPATGASAADTGQDQQDSDASAPADNESEASTPPETMPPEGVLAATALEELGGLLEGFDNPDDRKVGECMYNAGFPQYLESLPEPEGDRAARSPMSLYPTMYEPISESQAREFGMIGIDLHRNRRAQPGKVITSDRAYYQTLDDCRTTVRGVFTEEQEARLSAITATYLDLSSEIRTRFNNVITPVIFELSDDRLDCVKNNGYPLLDPARAREEISWVPILQNAGVELGEQPPRGGSETDQPLLEGDPTSADIRVVTPSELAPPTYRPSQSEIDFAIVYAECGNEVGALERLQEAQGTARSTILPQYETQVLGLRERVLEILDG